MAQDRVHLLALLDQPHHLLGGIADLLGRLAEMEEPAQRRGVDFSVRLRSTQVSSRSCMSSSRSSRWLTSAARPWSRSTSAE